MGNLQHEFLSLRSGISTIQKFVSMTMNDKFLLFASPTDQALMLLMVNKLNLIQQPG